MTRKGALQQRLGSAADAEPKDPAAAQNGPSGQTRRSKNMDLPEWLKAWNATGIRMSEPGVGLMRIVMNRSANERFRSEDVINAMFSAWGERVAVVTVDTPRGPLVMLVARPPRRKKKQIMTALAQHATDHVMSHVPKPRESGRRATNGSGPRPRDGPRAS